MTYIKYFLSEVSAVPSNTNYPEGGDYNNRAPNMSHGSVGNDSRGDYYSTPLRAHNYDYAQRQYLPQERDFVALQGSCSHCQAHCCQRPTEYQNQPTGSRGERLERYVGTVPNEPVSVPIEPIQEVRPRDSASLTYEDKVESPSVNERKGNAQSQPTFHKTVESNSAPCLPYHEPVERAAKSLNAPSCGHCPQQANEVHIDSCAPTFPVSPTSSIEPAHIAQESTGPAIPQTRSPEQNPPDPNPVAPAASSASPASGLRRTTDSVASLMIPEKLSPQSSPNEVQNQQFSSASLAHLNFKEKQLAMSAIKKAAMNMSCVNMFQVNIISFTF